MFQKDHEEACKILFGRPMDGPNKWIDACYPDFLYNGTKAHYGSVHYHWIERHHLQAITAQYGETSLEAQACKLHVMMDWLSHFGVIEMPKNSEEVKQLLDMHLGVR
jgi:hypothetical protein